MLTFLEPVVFSVCHQRVYSVREKKTKEEEDALSQIAEGNYDSSKKIIRNNLQLIFLTNKFKFDIMSILRNDLQLSSVLFLPHHHSTTLV